MEPKSDYSQLLRLAQSGAGQQLLQHLRRSGGRELDQALSCAANGDYTQAKALLGTLLRDPEAKALLQTLEDSL